MAFAKFAGVAALAVWLSPSLATADGVRFIDRTDDSPERRA